MPMVGLGFWAILVTVCSFRGGLAFLGGVGRVWVGFGSCRVVCFGGWWWVWDRLVGVAALVGWLGC